MFKESQEEQEGRPRGFRRPGERCEQVCPRRRQEGAEAGQMALPGKHHGGGSRYLIW